jgi:hypothetical protein
MTNPRPTTRPIVFLILGAIVALGAMAVYQPAVAQRGGPYHLVAHSNETANVGLFRINQASGQVSFCFVEGVGAAVSVRCTPEVE